MKGKIIYSFIMMLLALPAFVKAQAQPTSSTVYQNWKMLGESPTNYEVSARIVKCHPDSALQMHVEIFNEGAGSQVCHFIITIKNPSTNEQIIKEINYTAALGELAMPTCENSDKPTLRFNAPVGWNPETIQYTITFIP